MLLTVTMVSGPLAILSPRVAMAATAAEIQECREAELEAYRESTQLAMDEFQATIIAQWERQVGFRLRAASKTRQKTVERALQSAWKKHQAALVKQLAAYRTKNHADDARLAEILRTQTGLAQETALEKWTEAKPPAETAVRTELASMERTLRVYANARDRAVIKTVWATTLKDAFALLADELAEARGAAVFGYAACESEDLADDDSVGDDGVGTDAATRADSYYDDDNSAASNPVKKPEGASTAAQTDARSARPVEKKDPQPTDADSAASRASEPAIERIRLFSVTEGAASMCSAKVSLRAEIQGTPGILTKGYFYFGNGSFGSPVGEVRLDAQGKGVATFTHTLLGDGTAAGSRLIEGLVKYQGFVAPSGRVVESDRVGYRYECAPAGTAPSASPSPKPSTDATRPAGTDADSAAAANRPAANVPVVIPPAATAPAAPGFSPVGSPKPPETAAGTAASGAAGDAASASAAGSAAAASAAGASAAAGTSSVNAQVMVMGEKDVRACGPHEFTFVATLSAMAAERQGIKYSWERSDGGISSPEAVSMTAAGTMDPMVTRWKLSRTGTEWIRLRITLPSGEVRYSVEAPVSLVQSCASAI